MNEETFNMEVRKFLKKVGISSQREIEQAVQRALTSGTLRQDAALGASMQLRIPAIGLDTTITGTIELG